MPNTCPNNRQGHNVTGFIRPQHIKRLLPTVPSRSEPSLQLCTQTQHSVICKPFLRKQHSPVLLLLISDRVRFSCLSYQKAYPLRSFRRCRTVSIYSRRLQRTVALILVVYFENKIHRRACTAIECGFQMWTKFSGL